MKRTLNIIGFVVSCIAISLFTTIILFRFIPNIKDSCSSNPLDTFIFILTLIVAVLTIMVAFIGYYEFTRVNTYTEKVDEFVSDFNEKLETYNQNVLNIQSRLTQQELYLVQTINYLNSIIAELSYKTQDKSIIERLSRYSHIAQLYRISLDMNESSETSNSKFAAFAYFEESGIIEDIPHLEYVAQHDPNEQNKKRAREIIGHIREREKNKESEREEESESFDSSNESENNNRHNCFYTCIKNLINKKP